MSQAAHEAMSEARPLSQSGYSTETVNRQLTRAERQVNSDLAAQGGVGMAVDWLKENLGSSPSSSNWLGRTWSNVINSDNSSKTVLQNIQQSRRELNDYLNGPGDRSFLDHATASRLYSEQNGQMQLKATRSLNAYENSQKGGVNVAADTVALAAAFASRGRSGGVLRATAMGAFTKAGLKASDGQFSAPVDDAVSGAMIGMAAPAAAAGRSLGTRALSSAELTGKLGTRVEGLIVGAAEGSGIGAFSAMSGRYESGRATGSDRAAALANSFTAIPRGVGVGAATGAFFGGLLARAPKVEQSGGASAGAAEAAESGLHSEGQIATGTVVVRRMPPPGSSLANANTDQGMVQVADTDQRKTENVSGRKN